ncbi:hypothetical protein ScPMuIL_007121 [Solemya velum]
MPKRKLGYNWKARKQATVTVDKSDEKKIKVDLTDVDTSGHYDESNPLVLPSDKRRTKKASDTPNIVKKLSKNERKKLQKILDQKQKKEKRAKLLESLSHIQATDEEMNLLSSISEVHSGKTLRSAYSLKFLSTNQVEATEGKQRIKTVSGSNKTSRKSDSDVECSDSSVNTSDMSTDEDEDGEAKSEGSGKEEEKAESVVDGNVDKSLEEKKQIDSCVRSKTKQDNKKNEDVTTESTKTIRETVHVPLKRLDDVQARICEARQKLPILGEEQLVMEAINENRVVIICGETGSGKTTQVPQFLYEAGYAHGAGIIGITEPRRVAALSMSQRVAMEMNLTTREVSYQIRYEGNVTEDTKIKFMTDGVLLKEVQKDFLLTKYSVIVIDEAHERSVYTDILIGLLSRIAPLREKRGNPLKLIIMSATLRVEDFTENKRLFKESPPAVKVDSRQFPVTIHFNKKTPQDAYLSEAYRKVSKIHRTLPEGGILVFVTGQQEVQTLCRKLKQTFPLKQDTGKAKKVEISKRGKDKRKLQKLQADEKPEMPAISLDNYSVNPIDEEAELEGGHDPDNELTDLFGLDDDDGDEDILDGGAEGHVSVGGCTQALYVLPLFSLLPSRKQARVFEPPPEGTRLCVVATNVAETSLTIPNIKYVIDTGKVKTKFYDRVTGVSTFNICWTSKAAANQRAGRAGRVGPGHCYRLYSSAIFNDDFEKFSPAEITRRPVDDLILQMKDMNIEKVVNFPYPTLPDIGQLKAAEKLLVSLGALTPPEKPKRFRDMLKEAITKITPLGRAMASFPVSPRYAKMLSLGHQHDLLPYVVAMVAALSVPEVFVEVHSLPSASEAEDAFRQKVQHMIQIRKMWSGTGDSHLLGDLMVLLKAVGAFEYEGGRPEFCEKHGIRHKAMKEVRKLRAQLTNTVNTVMSGADLCVDPRMEPPNNTQAKLLRQIILAGLGDHVARKLPVVVTDSEDSKKKLKYAYQARGQVMCHLTSTFGRCAWKLPAVQMEYPSGLDKYKLFAQSCWKEKLQPRTETLLKTLISKSVDSKQSLKSAWADDPQCSLSAPHIPLVISSHTQVPSMHHTYLQSSHPIPRFPLCTTHTSSHLIPYPGSLSAPHMPLVISSLTQVPSLHHTYLQSSHLLPRFPLCTTHTSSHLIPYPGSLYAPHIPPVISSHSQVPSLHHTYL